MAYLSRKKHIATVYFLQAALFLLFTASPALGKAKPKITVQVVDSTSSTQPRGYTHGHPDYTTTACQTTGGDTQTLGSEDGAGNIWLHGTQSPSNTNCTTTYHPATEDHYSTYRFQVHVQAILPGGKHTLLWCAVDLRECDSLRPGSYQADLKGETVWIYVRESPGKGHKLKYRNVGSW